MKRAAGLLGFVGVNHVVLTSLPIVGYATASSGSESRGGAVARTAGDGGGDETGGLDAKQRRELGQLVLGLYRGHSGRFARVNTAYHPQATLDSPLLTLQGRSSISQYYSGCVRRLKPVQLSGHVGVRGGPRHVRCVAVNELTFAGLYTRRVPITVDLELDEDGLIIKQTESWDGEAGPNPLLAVNRQINSWLFLRLTATS